MTSDHPPIHIGLIGGSGLGEALGAEEGNVVNIDTPFGAPSSSIVQTQWHGVNVSILQRHGPGHLISPTQIPVRANIYALKKLGVTHIVASGATGSLREEIRPGDVVIADQVIDKTYKRVNTFYEKAAVHVEMAQPFCPVMRQWLLAAASRLRSENNSSTIHPTGTYICMEGPAFSTKAESLMHRSGGWGGDLIGMTAMPEAKLAREAEIAYVLVALPTDYDCWRAHDESAAPMDLLTEIIGNLKRATAAGIELIKAALQDVTMLKATRSPAHDALKLAIWSDKKKIDVDEVKKLSVLWGRHF